jgi:ATP-dependent protease ClpP protease subunit
MIGKIFITGQIGSTYNEDGSVKEKGVELVDVVSQFEPLRDCELIECYINSPGGSVEVGKQIAKYTNSIPNLYMIATGLCASIATEIHLSVPLECRKIIEGTTYMIHNPLFDGIGKANVNDLKEMVDVLEPLSKEMVAMYSNSTGTSKEAISALMDIEASLTEDQLLTLGFVSQIIPKLKPLAFINTNDTMKKQTIQLGLFATAIAKYKGRTIQAIIEDVAQGIIETPFSDLVVGDPMVLNGEDAPIDTYELPNGTKIVVTEVGKVGEIILPSGESTDYTDEITALKAEIESKDAEILALKSDLEAKDGAIALMETEHAEVVALVTSLKSKTSKYTPPAPVAQFKKTAEPAKSQAEIMAEKRNQIKNKK